MKTYRTALSIAGLDPSGGAGIIADLKTFSALNTYGMGVITASTAQNTSKVGSIFPMSTKHIEEQIAMLFEDTNIDAIKIGMLFNNDIIHTICQQLTQHAVKYNIPIVSDLVMVATSGHILLKNDAINAIISSLIPISTIITPNIPEAEALLNLSINSIQDMEEAAYKLASLNVNAVLIKGGHLDSKDSTDVLYYQGKIHHFTSPRIYTSNTHGTGCTLSSAIAAFLAHGNDIISAVNHAKQYLQQAIEAGAYYSFGKGHGPVFHACHA